MIKAQRFGVEIEMTGLTRKKAAETVAEMLNSSVQGPDSTCYHTRTIRDSKGRTWKVMRDSSIDPVRNDGGRDYLDEYRVEFVTPPLNYEDMQSFTYRVLEDSHLGYQHLTMW